MKNIEKITKAGFIYLKRYYPNTNLEIYERPKGKIIYNPENDEIVMRVGYTKLEEEK